MGSNETIHGRFQQAPYTAAQLTQTNPVLLDGEVMHESDTGKYKIGDGRTAWYDLPYKSGETATGEPFVVAYYSSPITTSRINFIHNNGYNANVTLANPYNNPGVPHVVFVQMFAGTTVLTDATGADITAQKGSGSVSAKSIRFGGYGILVCVYLEYYHSWRISPMSNSLALLD